MLVVLLLGIALLGAAATLAANTVLQPRSERRATLARAAGYAGAVSLGPEAQPLRERVMAPLLLALARLVLRLSPRLTLDEVRRRLIAAGVTRRISPTAFLAFKAMATLGFILVGVLIGGAAGKPGATLVLGFIFGMFGFILPGFLLAKRAAARAERVGADLPKAIDLLSVSVEAGMSFDGSVAKLVSRMDGPLVAELNVMLGEIRIGESREQALRNLAQRVDAAELSSFVHAVVQSELLGISLGRILRDQAQELRNRRQMKAEERSMKAPVKMLFPTVFFIFPAMFIVILAPAVMKLLEIIR
jgi:tight adherence protein C